MKNKTDKKISICGLDCADCPAFIARQNNNNELREKTARKWAKEFNAPEIKPEDINCLGCLSLVEPLYSHCKVCEVRKCGLDRQLTNCGECKNYDDCGKAASLHKMIPEAKAVCDEVRQKTT
ncbi:MAG: DUF3795 domain-containing protein [Candidatus Pacebacteria bacterium]|nr:DUF3795 domain-containing protein [Candidatus Paceibacterota bacterium]